MNIFSVFFRSSGLLPAAFSAWMVLCLPVFSQIRPSEDNFIVPPTGQTIAPAQPFSKTMKIGGRELKVSCTGWQHLEQHGTRLENDLFRLDATEDRSSVSLRQTITFDPPINMPIAFSAKAKGRIESMKDCCSLYLDVIYEDDTPLWGQAVYFPDGNFDFQELQGDFVPRKPVKEIQVFLLLRKARGSAWFDDIFVGPFPLELMRFQAVGGLFGPGSAAVVLRTNMSDPETTIDLEFARPDGGKLRSGEIENPLILLESADPTLSSVTATCRALLRGRETIVTETLDTSGCDAGRGYCVWTTTSMERIFPYSLPRLESDLGNARYSEPRSPEERKELRTRLAHPSASIALARNEYESFQIGILSPKKLEAVEVKLSDLVHVSEAKALIPAENLDWKQVGFVRADQIRRHPVDTEGGIGWWPDPLLPVDRFSLPAGQTQPIWVTVYAPKGTKPGMYRGTVSIVPKNGVPAEIPLSVEVWDFELADEGHFQNAFALMDGFLEKVYSMKPTTPRLRRRYGDFMLRHRLTPEGDISRTAPPVVEDLEFYRGRGLGVFNVLNMVRERCRATWVCNSPLEDYTPEFKRKTLDRLKPCIEELRKRGLSGQSYVYTFDERQEDYSAVMAEFFGMVKEHFPEVKTFTTSYFVHELEKMREMNVDWTCPLTKVYDFEEAEKCREDGRQVWSYICCAPDYPYANIMCRFPLIESRLIFWQSFQEKFDGLLYWGVNIWDQAGNVPIDPRKGPFLEWSVESQFVGRIYGDGRLIYAGIDEQPIGSIRLANLRDGLEDYEYLHQIREKNGGSWDKARKLCQPVTTSLTNFSRDPSVLYRQRQNLVRELTAPTPGN